MHFDFELVVFYITVLTGVVTLIDAVFFAPRRKAKAEQEGRPPHVPVVIDYCRSFFPILLIVFMLRSFLFEPYRIPSSSLEPTLLTGDFILVNKFTYGLRLPILHNKVVNWHNPERGDIMIFRWPANSSYNFIKRVIGLPGDHISYINKELTINGEKIQQTFIKEDMLTLENGSFVPASLKNEDLLGINHQIYIIREKPSRDYFDIIVPPGMYFVMGDNRDDSADSRYWGFVPEANIIGRAIMVWMSWDSEHDSIRWRRIAKWV